MARTFVQLDDRFREFGDDLDKQMKRGIDRVLRVGVASAQAKETRVKTGKTRASIRVLDHPTRNAEGWYASYGSTWYVARFLERGTRARKGAAKTARTRARRQAAGVSHAGVKPLRFLFRSAKEVRLLLPEAIRREAGPWRP